MDSQDAIERPQLVLTISSEVLAICQLPRDTTLPEWVTTADFYSVTRTEHELSVICPERQVPADVKSEGGWRALYSEGPLGFTLTGLLESLAEPLAVACVSIFVISTFTTDYLMVKQDDLDIAVLALQGAGHRVRQG